MNEVKITYETLFDLLRREKDREELQELDETFYADVLNYIEKKQSFLKEEGSQAGLIGASESEKTRVQIQNIKKIVKDLFERRQSKIIKLAVNKSKVNSTLTNTVVMLPEEKAFFNQLVEVFSKNREDVLNKILFFDNGEKKTVETPKPEPKLSKEDLKEIPVEEKEEPEKEVEEKKAIELVKEEATETEVTESKDSGSQSETEISETQAEPEKPEEEKPVEDEYDIKVKVRFTGHVPKFVGKKLEIYGPFEEGDTAELPKIIANILINKKRAEQIDT